jgi:hypothetical protein
MGHKVLVVREDGLETANPVAASQAVGKATQRIANATVGAATLVAGKDIVPGATLVRTGSVGAYSDTLPTGALMDAAFPEMAVGDSFEMRIASHVGFIETIVAGAQHTVVAGSLTAVPANASAWFRFTRASVGNWTYEQI